ncbi:DUF222 domain-containing protein [Pseudonocardia sp. NPDC049635]|uniref:HNH endonuclease n=1 Tax=Pseudonocardia sp. NPDC049635 TaxID=3155506 RepID=UPI0033CF71D5
MFDPVVDEADLTDLVLARPHWAEREPPEIDPEMEDEEAPHVLHPPAPGTPVIDPDSPPGARLALDIEYATALANQLTDTQLLEVVAATARHRNWLAALEHRVIALYADRHPRSGEAVRPGAAAATPVQQWLPDELGLVLAVSRERARGIIADAQRLAHVLPATLDALQSGRLDRCKVDTVLRATDVLDDEQARQVEAIVLANAAGATRRQIYDRLRRAVATVDPDGARRRHLRSLDDRRIGLSHGDDGMATLWLTGSAPDAQASWRSLDRLARSLGAEDPRTLEQRRVDLAHQLLQGTLSVTDLGQVHTAVESLLAATPVPVAPAAVPVTRPPAATARPGTEQPGPGTTGPPGPTNTDPTGHHSASRCGAREPADQPAGPARVPHHVLAEAVARALAQKPDPSDALGRKPLVQVVVSLDTLIGTSERPAELTGHGPIPATTARALAAGGVWQQLITHPATGRIRNVGRTMYSPPAAMADHVRARDGRCRGPACDHPVRDLDHHIPWARGGQTSEDNLHGYCRGCHTLKDRPGWQVLAHPDGTIEWISPHGWTSTSHPRDYRDLTGDAPPDASPRPGTVSSPAPAAVASARRDRCVPPRPVRTLAGSDTTSYDSDDAGDDPAPF